MKEFWLQARELVLPLTLVVFGLLWLSIGFYAKEMYKMVDLRNQIDTNGKINNPINGFIWFNPFLLFYLFASIPTPEKHPHYYEHSLFKVQVDSIKSLRKMYLFCLLTAIFFIIPVLYFLETLYTQ